MKIIIQINIAIILSLGLKAQTPRLVLYEEFTGENCLPCAGVNPGLDALLALPTNSTKCVPIKWQVPIPSAPTATWSLYQTNKVEIDWRYQSVAAGGYGYNIGSAPTGKIDGQAQTLFGASTDNPGNLSSGIIATAQSFTSAFNITMQRDWSVGCTAITLTVNIQASANFAAVGNLVFRTVMVERHIHFTTPPGSNGEQYFEDVAVKSYPSIQTGTLLPGTWISGQNQTFTLNCPIPSYVRRKSEIAFVGFIQDDGTKKVAQAVRCGQQPLPDDVMAIAIPQQVVCSPTFAPKAVAKNIGLNAITSMTLTPYVEGIGGSATTWTGNLAPSASTTITLSTFNNPGTIGAHTFSFGINTNDYDFSNNYAKVSFVVASSVQGNTLTEGFVSSTFPPPGFTLVNPDEGASWIRVNSSGIGGYGTSPDAAKYEFYHNTIIGDKDEFILPPMDLSGSGTVYLFFDVAYAQRMLTSNDKLEVLGSSDCGSNWTSLYSKSGTSLSTFGPYDGSEYFPGSSEWRTEVIPLSPPLAPSVLFKFVTTNDNGNNLYLDNINLSFSNPLGLENNTPEHNTQLFPNPAHDKVYLKTNSNETHVKIVNMLGQCVYEKDISKQAGTSTPLLEIEGLTTGFYTVLVLSGNYKEIRKLVVE